MQSCVNCRDLNRQLDEAERLQQLKAQAQKAITAAEQQKEVQKQLKMKLIRSRAELEVLLLEDKQVPIFIVEIALHASW